MPNDGENLNPPASMTPNDGSELYILCFTRSGPSVFRNSRRLKRHRASSSSSSSPSTSSRDSKYKKIRFVFFVSSTRRNPPILDITNEISSREDCHNGSSLEKALMGLMNRRLRQEFVGDGINMFANV